MTDRIIDTGTLDIKWLYFNFWRKFYGDHSNPMGITEYKCDAMKQPVTSLEINKIMM
jgi:hypothetical protein